MKKSGLDTGTMLECVQRIREGDLRARDELLRGVSARVEKLARKMLKKFPRVRHWEETMDVLQMSLLRLLQSLQKVDPPSMRAFYGLAAAQKRCCQPQPDPLISTARRLSCGEARFAIADTLREQAAKGADLESIKKSFRLQLERLQIKGDQASLTLSLNPAHLPNVNYRLSRQDGRWQVERPSLTGTWECSQRERLSKRAAEHDPFRLILRPDRRVLASGREELSPYRPDRWLRRTRGRDWYHTAQSPNARCCLSNPCPCPCS